MSLSITTVTLNPAIDKTVAVNDLKVGGLNRVSDSRIDAGGKGINVAKVLKGFNVDVIAAGLIAGRQGQQLLQYLEEINIPAAFINLPGETRTNLKIIDKKTKITTEINEAGFYVDVQVLEHFERSLCSHLDKSSMLVLSGSLPPGASKDIYKYYIQLAKSKGVQTILDADGEALLKGIEVAPYAIKPNIHELEKLIGRKLSTEQEITSAGKQLLNKGVNLIVISMGKEGAIVMDRYEAYRAKTFSIVPGSTVGSGDAMVAALAYAELNHFTMDETARWVVAAGTITASKSGTQVCALEEVWKSSDKVQLYKIY